MIRRPPTLIRITDFDVQDVRDVVSKQKSETEAQRQFIIKLKRSVDDPNLNTTDLELIEKFKSFHRRDKDKEATTSST